MRIAYQGEPGSFSEAAACEHFGPGAEFVPHPSFDAVFASVESHQVDNGFVPIENSTAGSIHRNYDLLLQYSLFITGERYLRVRHCLIGLPGTSMSQVRKVISHPQALDQCRGYIGSNLTGAEVEPVYDTAGAVKMVREMGDPGVVAVASNRAAQLYGMDILQEGIEDSHTNFTRFLAIGDRPAATGASAKTSVVFSLSNRAGALFRALSVFALRDIDLTKIESRPLVDKPWDYYFYVDFVGSILNQTVANALNHLSEYAMMLRVLGCYPRHQLNGKMDW